MQINKKNIRRKAQVLSVGILVLVTFAIVSAYILLTSMHSQGQTVLGQYEAGMIDTLGDSEKVMNYVDSAAYMSANQAFLEYTRSGGLSYYDNNIQGSDSDSKPYCGKYVYNLWNNNDENCYPNYSDLNAVIGSYMAQKTYLGALDKSMYIDNILSQKVDYSYYFDPSIHGTDIHGAANSPYTFYVFKDQATKDKTDVESYISGKIQSLAVDGDIPGISMMIAASTNYKDDNNRNIKYIVIHYTAGSDINGALSRFQDPKESASAHYIVGGQNDDFKIVQAVPEKDIAYHAGCDNDKYGCSLEDYKNINSESIGIEVVNMGYIGDASTCANKPDYIVAKDPKDPVPMCWQKYPEEQFKRLVALTALIAKKYNIQVSKDTILGHEQVVVKGKLDPGPAFDWDEFIKEVNDATKIDDQSLINQISSTSEPPCPVSSDTNWHVSNLLLSAKDIYSDQTLKITMTLQNDGTSCVAVRPFLTITPIQDSISDTSGNTINIGKFIQSKPKSFNVYPKSDQVPFKNIDALECTFTNDKSKMDLEIGNGNCVLYVPDDKAYTYKISVNAEDYNNHFQPADSFNTEFVVVKSAGYSAGTLVTINNNVLTKAQQQKVENTKQNLDNLGVIDEINQIADKYQIPREILLGKITQESSGVNYAIQLDKNPPNRAIGISQVEGWQHYDLIESTCGKDYVSECSACTSCNLNSAGTSCRNDLKSCCRFEKFHSDVNCQVEVGAKLLRQEYDTYNGNDNLYYSKIMASCSVPEFQNKYKQYQGWQRALRAYNGFGCDASQGNDVYVDLVMTYATGWGYAGDYSGTVKDELGKGIFGTYQVTPGLSTTVNFDLSLFDKLKIFVNTTVRNCGQYSNGTDKLQCINDAATKYNSDAFKAYTQSNINVKITTDCDQGMDKTMDNFVSQIEDCAASNMTDCQCVIHSDDATFSLNSSNDGSAFTYTDPSDGSTSEIDSDNPVFNGSDFANVNRINAKTIGIYKHNNTLRIGQNSTGYCAPNNDRFRLCLKTDYRLVVFDNGQYYYEPVTIPFAITLRDQIAPVPVSNLQLNNMPHSKGSIIATWNKNPETDVASYIIYLGDSSNDFKPATSGLKSGLHYMTLSSIKENYDEYKSIQIDNPVCEMHNDNNIDYCVFKYQAVDKYGTVTQISLSANKLYYMDDSKRFMYIINGTDPYSAITDSAKYVGITAVDADGNEMDNIRDGQMFSVGSDLVSITPKDSLETGFSKITNYQFSDDAKSIIMTWSAVNNYIDKSQVSADTIKYNLYVSNLGVCPAAPVDLSGMTYVASYQKADNNGFGFDGVKITPGLHCFGVTSSGKNGLEYSALFVSQINVPEPKK